MTEFLVSFELWTILYILILVPSCTFLIVFAYRIAKSLEMGLLERWNRRLVNQNKKVIMENIKASNELIDTQIQLRKELELTKKRSCKEMIEITPMSWQKCTFQIYKHQRLYCQLKQKWCNSKDCKEQMI